VHIDAAAAMTGISRFVQRPDWRYSKDEHVTDMNRYSHVVTALETVPGFVRVHAQEGFVGIGWRSLQIREAPLVFVHQRHDWCSSL
jgi:hypothetical protein